MKPFRKSLFFLTCLISFSCFSAPAEAGEWEREYTHYYSKESPTPKSYTFEIAPEAYWFFYEEPSLDVEWDGIFYGARASLTQRARRHPIIGRAEVHYSAGGVDYDGFLSNGTPHTDEGTDWIFEGRGTFGYEFVTGQTSIVPFAGLGYRYWLDDLESANAYKRNVRYLYSPVGFEVTRPFGDRWSWGLVGEFDFFWRGWVDSHLEDVNSSFNTIKNDQDSGFGARGSLYLKRTFREYTFSIEPFIRYWDIDDSDTAPVTFAGVLIGSGVEPANATVESGLQISLIW